MPAHADRRLLPRGPAAGIVQAWRCAVGHQKLRAQSAQCVVQTAAGRAFARGAGQLLRAHQLTKNMIYVRYTTLCLSAGSLTSADGGLGPVETSRPSAFGAVCCGKGTDQQVRSIYMGLRAAAQLRSGMARLRMTRPRRCQQHVLPAAWYASAIVAAPWHNPRKNPYVG